MSSISRSSGSWIAIRSRPFSLPSGRIRYLRIRSSGIRLTALGGTALLSRSTYSMLCCGGQGLVDVGLGAQLEVDQRLADAQVLGLGVVQAPADLLGLNDPPFDQDFAQLLLCLAMVSILGCQSVEVLVHNRLQAPTGCMLNKAAGFELVTTKRDRAKSYVIPAPRRRRREPTLPLQRGTPSLSESTPPSQA